MTPDDRKVAIAAYKKRKSVAGIYALRCTPTGQCWVGRAPDLATIQNRLTFTLKRGGSPSRSLQSAWTEHGDSAFSFEVLEELEEEESAYVRDRVIKDRHAHWRAQLGAETI
ncbi:GIY-YIG nuclease family protein [Consotaella aegiceratis]|uniref:GIY-YIG nuclease family protein n=1 Tax=Consotaella aegiceratis TaxID=3097961 RepID=UPI002F40E18B